MRGLTPLYLEKLDAGQMESALTSEGKFFIDNFISIPAEHCYVIGPTGSGKTNKNYNLVNWLKHTEVILWISASKDQDIVPLFFMGMPVNIIVLKYSGVEITLDDKPIENVTYSIVDDPSDVFFAIKKDHINILEVRNAFFDRGNLLDWMIDLFKLIAEWTRGGKMPRFRPDIKSSGKSKIAVFIDESQWLIAGSRITTDSKRAKATEVITENALEVRTYGWRLIISTQGFTNTPPALRQNMACVVLCNNAEISEPKRLAIHCNPGRNSIWVPTSRFERNECKFISRGGDCYPKRKPLPWPWYPKLLEDREKVEKVQIVYSKTFHDQHSDSDTALFAQCFPNLEKISTAAIPEEKETNNVNYNRHYLPEGEQIED